MLAVRELMPAKCAWHWFWTRLRRAVHCFGLKTLSPIWHVELLLGEGISVSQLNDDAVGRVLDCMYEVGTNKVLSAVALRAPPGGEAVRSGCIPRHHDTTSRSVYGDYELLAEGESLAPFLITHGFSKDHRPDLKQLIHSLLCVDDGIPIYTKCEDGNASDKVINKNLIRKMTERMKELGQQNFVYVADSALVTKQNLRLMVSIQLRAGCERRTKAFVF